MSRDPIEEEGGLNLYGYVGGNPIDACDPLGLDFGPAGGGTPGGDADWRNNEGQSPEGYAKTHKDKVEICEKSKDLALDISLAITPGAAKNLVPTSTWGAIKKFAEDLFKDKVVKPAIKKQTALPATPPPSPTPAPKATPCPRPSGTSLNPARLQPSSGLR